MPLSQPASDPGPAVWPEGWMPVDMAPGASGVARVRALMSARAGGISDQPYASCNLGDHVQDAAAAVARNRDVFAKLMQARPAWLTQVHGNRVVRLRSASAGHDPDDVLIPDGDQDWVQPRADGAFTTEPGLACVVMVADCLPILLAAPEGRGVAALHAGWRGLAGAGDMRGRGIIHTGVTALCEATGCAPGDLQAWLGPCIGPTRFEVGADVLQGFGLESGSGGGHRHFVPQGMVRGAPRWLADLPGLAQDMLLQLGVTAVSGGRWCTVSDAARYFSFRRDGVTGRQAAGIAILPR